VYLNALWDGPQKRSRSSDWAGRVSELFKTESRYDGTAHNPGGWDEISLAQPQKHRPTLTKTRLLIPALISSILMSYVPASSGSEGILLGLASLPPGQVPPLPQPGILAQPRSTNQVGLPLQLTEGVIPPDNRLTPEKIQLGEQLFFDGRPASIGIKGRVGQPSAPTVLNALYNKFQFWDSRATNLEDQAALPIVNPLAMGQPTLNAAVTNLARVEEYRQAFLTAFGRPFNGSDCMTPYDKTSSRKRGFASCWSKGEACATA
jgi:hypothetical protein